MAGTPTQRLTSRYDVYSRRISKNVEGWKGGHYQEQFTMFFINQYLESKTYSVGYERNGDVMTLFSMPINGELAASHEYGLFLEALKAIGAIALISSSGFSTKYAKNESGLVCYKWRFHIPKAGRWINRNLVEGNGWA